MERTEKHRKKLGLIGKNISYSFSRGYFSEKFEKLGLNDYSYENFDLPNITELPNVLKEDDLIGLNVTIPYKEEIIPYLDELDGTAENIGAVNTIKVSSNGLIGFNTDAYGFQKALLQDLRPHHKKALILGTGGASKAIAHVLGNLNIDFNFVSRKPSKTQYAYKSLNQKIIETHTLIINCTPLGTYPKIENKPEIPYQYLFKDHLLFDLIYNPEKTEFLRLGEEKGAAIQNGLAMLQHQAEKAWLIWNS